MLIINNPKVIKPDSINWFKVQNIKMSKEEFSRLTDFIFNERLPFDIVGILYDSEDNQFILKNIDEDTMELGLYRYFFYTELLTITKNREKNQLDVTPINGALEDNGSKSSIFYFVVASFFKGLQKGYSQVFKPVGHKSNPKRIKKGKKPIYEWKLIDIKPKSSRVCLGGTHSSPRQHQRRGHWRLIKKTGNRVWVKSCTVGSAENGVINHVYRI